MSKDNNSEFLSRLSDMIPSGCPQSGDPLVTTNLRKDRLVTGPIFKITCVSSSISGACVKCPFSNGVEVFLAPDRRN